MKHKWGLLIFILSVSVIGFSQKPESLLAEWNQKAPIEKVYLHIDKDNYLAGEHIWFKAYLQADYLPDTISTVLYAELIDKENNILDRKIMPVLLGTATGQFELSDSLETDNYFIRAYTPTLLNNGADFVFRKSIFVFGKKQNKTVDIVKLTKGISLQFFPEGGNFVNRVTNTIAFMAKAETGLPVQVNGIVYNARNDSITSFSSFHDGMGSFEMIPNENANYYVMLDADESKQKFFLPASANKGIALSMIPHPQGIFFEIQQVVASTSFKAAYMLGQMQHQIVFRQEFTGTKDVLQGLINTEKLNSGILQITIFNKDDLPIAERLYFVNNKEYLLNAEVETDTLNFSEKSRNHFKFRLKDTIQGSFSIAITDAGFSFTPSRQESILSSLLLTADLKGTVHNPAWYFSADNDSTQNAIDYLMMTNGWRRFKWVDLKDDLKTKKLNTDPAFITIAGKVTLQGTKKPFALKQLIAIISSEGIGQRTQMIFTDQNGIFKLDSLLFFGKARIFLIDTRGKKSQYIDVVQTGDSIVKKFSLPFSFDESVVATQINREANPSIFKAVFEYLEKEKGLMMEEVTLKVEKKSPSDLLEEKYTSGLFSSESVRTFDLINTDQYITDNTIFDYLSARVPGIDVASDGVDYTIYYRQGPTASSLGAIPMVIYLNEVEVEANVLATIPPTEIALVKIFSNFAAATGNGAGGVLTVYTKKGSDLPMASRGDLLTYKGFSITKEFYAPNYKTDLSAIYLPDRRTTLVWRPNILLNNINPILPVSFYNSDQCRSFRIVMEGMTTDGKILSFEKTIYPSN